MDWYYDPNDPDSLAFKKKQDDSNNTKNDDKKDEKNYTFRRTR